MKLKPTAQQFGHWLPGLFAAMIAINGYAADAHQHGAAELNMVVQLPEVMVELVTPAANLVGFEHMPQNAQQRQLVEQAKQQLEQPAITLLGAQGCKLVAQDADWGAMAKSDYDHDEHHDHEENHDKAHDHDEHHEKEHAHEEHYDHEEDHDKDHDHETHQDVTLNWQYNCDAAQAVSGVRVDLFDSFPALTQLRVQLVDPQGQYTTDLNPDQRVLTIDD